MMTCFGLMKLDELGLGTFNILIYHLRSKQSRFGFTSSLNYLPCKFRILVDKFESLFGMGQYFHETHNELVRDFLDRKRNDQNLKVSLKYS